MDIKVVAEGHCRRQHAGSPGSWPDGTAHLVANGSAVTLCAQAADRFLPMHEVPPHADDVAWCEVCALTWRT